MDGSESIIVYMDHISLYSLENEDGTSVWCIKSKLNLRLETLYTYIKYLSSNKKMYLFLNNVSEIPFDQRLQDSSVEIQFKSYIIEFIFPFRYKRKTLAPTTQIWLPEKKRLMYITERFLCINLPFFNSLLCFSFKV